MHNIIATTKNTAANYFAATFILPSNL